MPTIKYLHIGYILERHGASPDPNKIRYPKKLGLANLRLLEPTYFKTVVGCNYNGPVKKGGLYYPTLD